MPNSFYAQSGKRAFDFILAAFGVLLLSPVFALTAIAVKLSGPGATLFSHRRIGLKFKPFLTYKFRTMVVGADKDGSEITAGGDSRITSIGRLLRKYKLDELPQLVNVLIGDMSFVGPRPEVEKYVEIFRADYETILSVRPGITDYAAIEYRNEEEVLARYSAPELGYVRVVLPDKIVLYKKYIKGMSLSTDVKIILETVWSVFK